MAKWKALRATFPEDELEEIDRIRKKYKISYNEIIRSGVKFYVGLTVAKELLATASYSKGVKILGKDLGDLLTDPSYQAKMEQTVTKLIKMVILELLEKGMDFQERTRTIRKERKVGRPKRSRKVGRPKQSD